MQNLLICSVNKLKKKTFSTQKSIFHKPQIPEAQPGTHTHKNKSNTFEPNRAQYAYNVMMFSLHRPLRTVRWPHLIIYCYFDEFSSCLIMFWNNQLQVLWESNEVCAEKDSKKATITAKDQNDWKAESRKQHHVHKSHRQHITRIILDTIPRGDL